MTGIKFHPLLQHLEYYNNIIFSPHDEGHTKVRFSLHTSKTLFCLHARTSWKFRNFDTYHHLCLQISPTFNLLATIIFGPIVLMHMVVPKIKGPGSRVQQPLEIFISIVACTPIVQVLNSWKMSAGESRSGDRLINNPLSKELEYMYNLTTLKRLISVR